MTINELDQAIRTIVISQPMIAASPIGGTITNLLSVIDNFRNFKLSVQSYPMQDSFKFLTLNECQRLENTLTLSICQVLQEKGLNVMSYLPTSFGPVHPVQNPSIMGQMAFTQPMTPVRPMGQFQPDFAPQVNGRQTVQFNRPFEMQNRMMAGMQNPPPMPPQQPMYPRQNQSQFGGQSSMFHQSMNEQPMSQPKPRNSGRAAQAQMFTSQFNPPSQQPVQPKTIETPKPRSTKMNEVEILKPSAIPTTPKAVKSTPTMQVQMNEPDPIEEPVQESFGEEVPPKKAAGRDYLLQLLKK